MKKRFLSILLAMTMMLSWLPLPAAAAASDSGTCGEGLTWSFEGETLSIEGSGATADYADALEVPWQAHWDDITGVEIGDGVTRLGSNAFIYANTYRLLFRGAPPTTLGPNLFFESRVTPIVYYPADRAAEWTEEAVQELFAGAGITHLLPIPAEASGSCGADLTWSYADGTLTIGGTGDMYNYGASNLPPWLYWALDLTDITIGAGVTHIGNNAFNFCLYGEFYDRLLNLDFSSPEAPTFGDTCFPQPEESVYCAYPAEWDTAVPEWSGPAAIWTPKSSTSGDFIGGDEASNTLHWAFDETTATLTLSGVGSMPWFSRANETPWFYYHDQIRHVVIEDGITNLSGSSFSNFTAPLSRSVQPLAEITPLFQIETLTVNGDTLTSIDNMAFAYVDTLRSIQLPDSLEYIGYEAFIGCSALESVTFPDALQTISDGAFQDCTGLESVEFSNSLQTISDYAFSNCTTLEQVFFAAGTRLKMLGWRAFENCSSLREIVIPDGPTEIGYNTFEDCTSLTKASLPASITKVYDYAFAGCTAMKDLYYAGLAQDITYGTNAVPESVTIHYATVSGENWLYDLNTRALTVSSGTLPGGILSEYANQVQTIRLETDVTGIDPAFFQEQTQVTSITVAAENTALQVLNDGSLLLTADGKKLLWTAPLQQITVPASVTSIGSYAFISSTDQLHNTTVQFQSDAPTLEENALAGLTYADTVRYDTKFNGWDDFRTTVGSQVYQVPLCRVESLTAEPTAITGDAIQLTVTLRLGLSNITTVEYSLDGQTWTLCKKGDVTGSAVYTIYPQNLGVTAETEQVIFRAYADEAPEEAVLCTVGTQLDLPAPIIGLRVQDFSDTAIVLAWDMIPTADQEQFDHFTVQSQNEDGTWRELKTIEPDSSGKLTCGAEIACAPGETYLFRVASVYQNGYAGPFAEITATSAQDVTKPELSWTHLGLDYPKNKPFKVYAHASDNYRLNTAVLDYSTDGGATWTLLQEFPLSGKNWDLECTLPIDLMEDGLIQVRGVVTDDSGNRSVDYIKEYLIDKTPPAAPIMDPIQAQGTTEFSITWSTPTDTETFRLYRSTDNQTWERAASGLTSNGYTDRSLAPSTTYYYCVTAVDLAGNESAKSSIVSAQTQADAAAPTIVAINPATGNTLGPGQTIKATAADETCLAALTLYYRTAGSEAEWEVLKSAAVSGRSASLSCTLNGLPSGTYELTADAVDSTNNTCSKSGTVTYTLDATAPVIRDLTAQAGTEAVTLSWNSDNEPDLAGFYLYRSTVSGGWTQVGSVSNKGTGSYTFHNTLNWQQCGREYTYQVVAVDSYNNQAFFESNAVTPSASSDEQPPVVVLTAPQSGFVNDVISFSAAGSYDDREITSYHWDFGDGSTSDSRSAKHTYTEGGNMTVTLTAADAAGNETVKTASIQIYDTTEYAQVNVTVLGYSADHPDEAAPLSNAQVVFDLGGGNTSYYTDSTGNVQFRVIETGEYRIGGYKQDYLPAAEPVTLALGETVDVTLRLEKAPIVTGTLSTRELSYQEIKDLGIDVTAPENQNVYQYYAQIDIGGNITEYTYFVNDSDQVINGVGSTSVQKVTVGDSSYTLQPHVTRVSRPSSTPGDPPKEVTVSYVTVLRTPGTVSVLKQFFEAELTVVNQADEEFSFHSCTATLNIPDGLSLVPTETTASTDTVILSQSAAEADTGIIDGQQSASVRWILRGDEPGTYQLSADFDGVLRDFEAPIHAKFEAEDPIVVNEPSEICLDMYVSNVMLNRTIYVDLELYCNERLLNLPQITFGEYIPKQYAVRAANGTETVRNGPPEQLQLGEVLIYRYEITLDEEVNLLFESNLLRNQIVSDDLTVRSFTRNIRKFTLFPSGTLTTDLDIFLEALPKFTPAEAQAFCQFIYNTKTPPASDDLYYKLLCGNMQDYDGTLEELRMLILAMNASVRSRLNVYARDAEYQVGYLTGRLCNMLWDELGGTSLGDLSGDIQQEAREQLVDQLAKMLSTADAAVLRISAAGIKSAQDTMDALDLWIKGLTNAAQALGIVISSEWAGRYEYFNYYLNQRINYEAPDDTVFAALLDTQSSLLHQRFWQVGGLDAVSWITGADSWINHTDDLNRWAETFYQMEVMAALFGIGSEPQPPCTHVWDSGTVTTEPTCTTAGVKTYICSLCSREKTEPVPMLDHSFSTDWSGNGDTHWHACSCGAKRDEAAHTPGGWIIDQAATETQDGSKHKECTVCSYVTERETIPATGGEPPHLHNGDGSWQTSENEHWHVCSDCGEPYDRAAHTPGDWIIDQPATETQDGSKHKECTVCSYVTERETIPATGGEPPHLHNGDGSWQDNGSEHWHVCSNCGEPYDRAAHTPGGWIIDQAATETQNGSRHKECTVCSYVTERETIPATGGEPPHLHNGDGSWQDNGSEHWHVCSNCGEPYDRAAHTPGGWIIDQAATETQNGSRHKECTVCSYVTKRETIPATGGTDDSGDSSGSSADGGSSKPSTDSTVTTNPDGSTTTTETNQNTGTVTETTEYPDGSWTQTVTRPDGSRTSTEKQPDGVTIVTDTGADGGTTATVDVPTDSGKGQETPISIPADLGRVDGTVPVEVTYPGGKTEIVTADYAAGKVHLTVYGSSVIAIVGDLTPTISFVDVDEEAHYYAPVLWAVKQEVTSGLTPTTFGPQEPCSRAQAITFLWRAMGCPEPAMTEMPFSDVPTDAYYYKAVLWAVEQGITSGTSAATFSPDATVTRAQTVTFLWRSVGAPQSTVESPFVDVDANSNYTDAVLWATEQSITNGTSTTTFDPNSGCTRGQLVTFLWRYMEN